ncbi:MAG: hypothetical protein OEW05_12475 [Candidatus Aminicenantes bacterium]|nr:hypothetical protein [Candidatus Aminicenantes bacterium]
MRKYVCFSALVLFVLGLGAAASPQKIDLSGTWVGFAERMGSQDGLTVVLEKKEGFYAGKLTDQMGMFPGVEIKNLVLKDDAVTFEFDGGSTETGVFTLKAEMTLSGDTMKGTWKMAGADQETGAIELSRQK